MNKHNLHKTTIFHEVKYVDLGKKTISTGRETMQLLLKSMIWIVRNYEYFIRFRNQIKFSKKRFDLILISLVINIADIDKSINKTIYFSIPSFVVKHAMDK